MTRANQTSPLALTGAAFVAVLVAGCGPLRPQPPGCPDVMCLMYCENGFATDANGCSLCECEGTATDAGPVDCPEVACAMWCPTGFAHDANGCDVCACNAEVSCWTDSDCASGQRCDTVNYCQPPPGCDPGEACPPVCAGLCVVATTETLCFSSDDCAAGERCTAGNEECLSACTDPSGPCIDVCAGHCVPQTNAGECKDDSDCRADQFCAIPDCAPPDPTCFDAAGNPCEHTCAGGMCVDRQPPQCEGAWRDQNGTCRTPWDGVYPDACCDVPWCLAGEAMCDMVPPPCPEGSVRAIVNGCYGECVDPRTCEPVKPTCGDQSQVACERMPPVCPDGLVPSVVGLCWGPCVDPVTCEEPGPKDCNDGSTLQCRMRIPDCLPPFQVAIVNGCYQCLEPTDCQSPCTVDSDCDAGESCVEEYFDPCANIDPAGPQCGAPVRLFHVCRPQVCTGLLTCRLFCEYGYVVDPATGCEQCACNPPPPDCEIQCTVYQPVCGTDGVTYGCGAPDARCHGVEVAYEGECRNDCQIECFRYDPVCGTNGVTYGCGAVEAECNGVAVAYAGECRPSCLCTQEYNPQCGADGVTYGNPCEARCAQATIVHAGACVPVAGSCTDNAQCSWGQKCFTGGTSTDPTIGVPAGRCVAADYCETNADCSGLAPTQSCQGGFACQQNTCTYLCR